MRNQNLVSVIVPCYNQAKYLAECLNSIKKQTYDCFECIIVDDGSTDNSSEIASTFVKEDVRFKLFKIVNGGVANARNYGIDKALGEYILPLDGDDKISSEYIESGIDILMNNSEIDVVYCKARFFGKKRGRWNLHEFSIDYMLGCNCVFCSAIFRKSIFQKTMGYNIEMRAGYEDWDFWLSMIEVGAQFYRIDKELFFYRIRSRSRQKSIDERNKIILRNQIYNNHKELYSNHFFNPLYSFEYLNVANSIEYKIGCFLMKPIRFIYEQF